MGDEAPVAVLTPQLATTVYVVITLPPVHEGAVKLTDAQLDTPAVAEPMVGALATFKALYPGRFIPAL